MHCTLLIPDLLLPRDFGSEPYAGLRLPALGAMLARGDTVMRPALAREEWLCDRFGVPAQQDRPLAALMLKADGGEPAHHYWLCAEPIQLRVDTHRLIVAGRAGDFTPEETRELIAALNQHFAEDDMIFFAPSPSRWYLRAPHTPRLTTTPLARALNRSVKHHLPQGDDALAWHRVMNEAQMILHDHPVTAAREARGAIAANSIWLWGGGTLPAALHAPYAGTWGGGYLVRALAAAAGIAHAELPAHGEAWLDGVADGRHLLAIDAPANALHASGAADWRAEIAALDDLWIRPLLAALRAKKLGGLGLIACNSGSLLETNLEPANLWRLWRRSRPLAAYAVDASRTNAT